MIELRPLAPDDREQFILDNQEAFNYGALEEFGRRDDHFEEDEQIIVVAMGPFIVPMINPVITKKNGEYRTEESCL